MRRAILLPFVAVALLLAHAGAEEPDLSVEKPFPDLRLPSLADGRLHAVSEHRGRKTAVLVFASW